MDNIKWYIGQKVILSRKKDNGHPRHRNIGEELEVVWINLNPKCPRLCIKGNRRPGLNSGFTSTVGPMASASSSSGTQ